MNKGMLTVGIIILALMGLLLINVISNYSTGSELDYYLVKETAEAAIEDSIDLVYYSSTGAIRMDKEKFVENFLRRFADSIDNTRNYKIGFYDLNEVPPKVSVKVNSSTVLSFDGENAIMETTWNGIVESDLKEDLYLEESYKDPNNELGLPITIDGNTYTTKSSNTKTDDNK